MNINLIGGASNEPPSKDTKVSRSKSSSSSKTRVTRGDAVSVDRATVSQVSDLKGRLLDSPDVRKARVEELRRDYREGRLRDPAMFDATAEAIVKGQLHLDGMELDELA